MAKVLSAFTFSARSEKSRYPWAEWSDGKIRQLKQGDDFTCKPGAVIAMARSYAKKNGMALRASLKKDSDTVVLQFYKPEHVNGAAPDATKTSKRKTRQTA